MLAEEGIIAMTDGFCLYNGFIKQDPMPLDEQLLQLIL